ncbi:MBL fold metallo-hydrolase [Sinorhizobium medicae]|uniref:MBL fold metallo-hydrolase n=1 Tax=Sinorhizobium medicae TaxID=110321 RepID=UPI00307ED77A
MRPTSVSAARLDNFVAPNKSIICHANLQIVLETFSHAQPASKYSLSNGAETALTQLADVDAVVVTHLHSDHWDDEAAAILDKKLPLFAQNDEDAAHIRSQGFQDVRTLTENTEFQGIHLAKTGGQHGTDATLEAIPALGQVCGVVFSHPSNKRLYLAGDTIWNEHVAAAISRHHPEIIVLNAGKAVFPGFPPIIMGEEDVLAVHKAAPEATLIASHMEAVNHCVLSRAALRAYSEEQGFASSLLVPADGETLAFK